MATIMLCGFANFSSIGIHLKNRLNLKILFGILAPNKSLSKRNLRILFTELGFK